MKKSIKIPLIIVLALVLIILALKTFSDEDTWLCVNGEWIPHGNPSSPKPASGCAQIISCDQDSDCETPMEFLVQSNCPFGSACLNQNCAVVCPLYESSCSADEDCDCSGRGPRSKNCVCHKDSCVSVEA